MVNYRSRSLLLALSAATVASTLTVAGGSASARAEGRSPVVAASPVPSALVWVPCPRPELGGPVGQECATLRVPLDHADPAGPQLALAVSRVRSASPERRRGVLMVVPGGPGGSGVQRLAQKGKALQAQLNGAYDLVGLDPRGVGGSTRASCELPAADNHLVALRSWPGPTGEIDENIARSRRTADLCARNGGPVLRSFTSANQVRDMDVLRRALGEKEVSAWGTSYGAYIGALYAQKYPRHTDRWVLDSNGDPDPDRVGRGWLANMGQAADDRFPDFAAWAADPARDTETAEGRKGLRLAQEPGQVRPLVLALAAALDRAPKESDRPGVPLTGNRLRQALQNALYSDSAFPQLAKLIVEARSTDPKMKPALTPDIAGPLPDADAAITMAVVCNDVRWPAAGRPGTLAAYRERVAADRARHPLTAGMPANVTPCSFWKWAPAEKPARITAAGPSNVLMIQNLRDPATPYSGALKMRAALGDRARLVTVDSGGHGVYLGTGNACGDAKVTEFLTTGKRPAGDTYCAK